MKNLDEDTKLFYHMRQSAQYKELTKVLGRDTVSR